MLSFSPFWASTSSCKFPPPWRAPTQLMRRTCYAPCQDESDWPFNLNGLKRCVLSRSSPASSILAGACHFSIPKKPLRQGRWLHKDRSPRASPWVNLATYGDTNTPIRCSTPPLLLHSSSGPFLVLFSRFGVPLILFRTSRWLLELLAYVHLGDSGQLELPLRV